MATGIDSLGATELRKAIDERFSAELPATLLFDYPSIQEIASVIVISHCGKDLTSMA